MLKKTQSEPNKVIIKATPEIYDQLAHFLNQPIQLHRHLDWFGTLDWLGYQPYLIEMVNDKIQAVLCGAPENEESAWVRTFGAQKHLDTQATWNRLFSRAVETLTELGVERLAALALHSWFETLLVRSGFYTRQNIIVLEWGGKFPPKENQNRKIEIRPMHLKDLPEVERIDRMAFPPLWQNSLAGLKKAFQQTGICTIATLNSEIVGYQISTTMTIYGHLARLAVHPSYQRQGIAFMLVYDLLQQFERRGFWRVTVNTQSDNKPSLKLYQKFGFTRTREEIPVYEFTIYQVPKNSIG